MKGVLVGAAQGELLFLGADVGSDGPAGSSRCVGPEVVAGANFDGGGAVEGRLAMAIVQEDVSGYLPLVSVRLEYSLEHLFNLSPQSEPLFGLLCPFLGLRHRLVANQSCHLLASPYDVPSLNDTRQ